MNLPLSLQAGRDLLGRYANVFRAAWQIRHELDSPERQSHELAFLPAHLELAETPIHPAPKWAIRIIVLFVLLAVIWSIFGKIDIVATAQGKIIPNAQVKLVQPMDTGVVRSILVHDGERVKAGQTLIELDTTLARADTDKSRAARQDAALTAARAQALLGAQQTNHSPAVPAVAGIPPERQQETQRFADGLYNEYEAKIGANESELAKRKAELETARREVEKLNQTAPLARQSADNYKALVKDSYVSRQDYLEKEQAAIEQGQELVAQQSHTRELLAGIDEQEREISATTAQFRREQLDILNQAQQQLGQTTQDEAKANQRQTRMKITAPVSGTVQQLNVHTVGGVVQTAQSLMEIVPDDTLEIEASVDNKDIGFVDAGQDAIIKIETFPYTRYGYLTGKVIKVSNDATQDSKDKKAGLIYPARVTLPTSRIHVDNKWVNLTPGMAVTVEVKTGKRRVAEYFLSPLVEYASESLRER